VLISGEVWVHHLFVSGLPDWIRMSMMMATLLISIPVGLLMISLIGTLYKGSIQYTTPMLYAVCWIFLFLIGGLTGIPFALTALDINFSDTAYVTAHFHYVMAVAMTFAIFGGVYYLLPKMSGKMYSEFLGKLGVITTFIGVNVTFMAMFIMGLEGVPRRYYDYAMMPEVESLQQIQTYGSFVIGIGFFIVLISWIHCLVAGKKAPPNPWGSKSLEWTHTSSPPGPGNYGGKDISLPDDWDPYDYSQ
jgi:cytochrome c oxidase subunit 1